MKAILQTVLSNLFNSMRMCEFLLIFFAKGPIDNVALLVQKIAWSRTGDQPLTELMIVLFTDAYMHHSISIS